MNIEKFLEEKNAIKQKLQIICDTYCDTYLEILVERRGPTDSYLQKKWEKMPIKEFDVSEKYLNVQLFRKRHGTQRLSIPIEWMKVEKIEDLKYMIKKYIESKMDEKIKNLKQKWEDMIRMSKHTLKQISEGYVPELYEY